MFVFLLAGCIQHLDQIGGTGSVYTTRCSSDMEPTERGYRASCTPPTCIRGYTDAGVSHAVVTLDPGRRVLGVAERVCVQDLSNAAALFETPDASQMHAGQD